MSAIKALDELCEWAGDRLDGSAHADALRLADAIEREIAERYMALPVDAEGVPVHTGDLMVRCCAGESDRFRAWFFAENGDAMDEETSFFRSSDCRHVKQRSLEDVLADVRDGNLDTGDAAAEIRGLMEGGA